MSMVATTLAYADHVHILATQEVKLPTCVPHVAAPPSKIVARSRILSLFPTEAGLSGLHLLMSLILASGLLVPCK